MQHLQYPDNRIIQVLVRALHNAVEFRDVGVYTQKDQNTKHNVRESAVDGRR